MQSSMVSMPSPARTKVSGLQAPVRPASTDGRLKIPLPITPLMMAAVKSQPALAGGLRRRGRVADDEGSGWSVRRRGAAARVLARDAGGAEGSAAALPLDRARTTGPALRQRDARQRGPGDQRPQLLLSRLQR